MKQLATKYTYLVFPLLLLIAAIVLLVQNSDVLRTAYNQSLFLTGADFFHESMRHVGGLLSWAGLAGVTLFHSPMAGAALLLVLWSIIYALLRCTFPLPRAWRWCYLLPVAALLASIVGVGYWIFYLKMPGYWVRESLGIIVVLLLLQADRGYGRWVAAPLAAACYPLIGWYASLSLLLLATRQLLRRQWVEGSIALVLLVFVPRLIAGCYTTLCMEDAWLAHFPAAQYLSATSSIISRSFITVVVSLIVLSLLSHFQPKRWGWPVGIVLMAATLFGLYKVNVSDPNFHAELRMYEALQEQRWGSVLSEMKKAPQGPTRQMICCKNVALLHKGTLIGDMFKYDNNGPDPVVPDSLNLHLTYTAAPLLYLYHGMANDAIHWAIENSVEYGLSVDRLKILTQAALVSRETQLAAKYLEMLRLAPFEHEFVEQYAPLVQHPEEIAQRPELALMCELHDQLPNVGGSDQGSVEWHIYRTFATNTSYKSRKMAEVALTYAMMMKNYDLFWPQMFRFGRFVKTAGEIPTPVQEALYLGCKNSKVYKESNFVFAPAIPQRYETMLKQLKPVNDHSYWYFYLHCKNAHTY